MPTLAATITLATPLISSRWTSQPFSVVLTNNVGLLQDVLTVELDLSTNLWGVDNALDFPNAVTVAGNIGLTPSPGEDGETQELAFGGFHVGPADYATPGILSLTCKRLNRATYQSDRLLLAAAERLVSPNERAALNAVKLAGDLQARIVALRQYGFGVHVDTDGKFTVFALSALFDPDQRSRSPFADVSDTAVDLDDASGSISMPDIATRQDYTGSNLFARVNNPNSQSIGVRVGITGADYVPQEGVVERQIPGVFPDLLSASQRMVGERDNLRLGAESASIESPLRLDVQPGSVLDWQGYRWVALSCTYDTGSLSTGIQAVRYQ